MKRTHKVSMILSALLSLTLASALSGQDVNDALRPFYGFTTGNTMTQSVGHASVAAGQVIPEMGSNPANIGLQRFRSFNLGYSSGSYDGNGDKLNLGGLSSLSLIFPIPVYQGSLSAGFGFTREYDYAMDYYDDISHLREEGSMKSLHAALAVEFEKNLFLGASLKYLFGSDEMLETDLVSNDKYLWQPKYKGISLNVGLLQRLTPWLNIGLSAEYPAWISVNEQYSDAAHAYPQTYRYSVSQSPVLRGGLSLYSRFVNVFYEAEYCSWPNLNFSSNLVDGGVSWDISLNQDIENSLHPTLNHHVGLAVHLPILPVHIYGGYQLLPDPHNFSDQTGINGGLTYLLNQNVGLSVSWQKLDWTYGTLKENWSQSSLAVNFLF